MTDGRLDVVEVTDPAVTTLPRAAEPVLFLYRALGAVLALRPAPACVVLTGRLTAHDGADEREVLGQLLTRFPLPIHQAGRAPGEVHRYGDARVIVLGLATDPGGRWLSEQLSAAPTAPTLVFPPPSGQLPEPAARPAGHRHPVAVAAGIPTVTAGLRRFPPGMRRHRLTRRGYDSAGLSLAHTAADRVHF